MYDAEQVLWYIDHHLTAVIAAAAIACIGGVIQYGEGVRRGFKDKSHAIPLATNMYIFAHDVTYVSMYSTWFGRDGHWFNRLFWVFILPFVALEIVVFAQTLCYSREEMMPGLSTQKATTALVGAQVGFFFLFWFLRSMGSDPLYVLSFTTTIIASNLFSIPMTLRRHSRRGQSVLLSIGLVCLSWGWSLVMVQLSPAFRSPAWIGALICNAFLAVVNLIVLLRFPAHGPAGVQPRASHSSILRPVAAPPA